MAEAGKGSRPRPFSVSQQEFDNRWEAIFGNKDKSTEDHSEDEKITDHSEEDQ
jgi:hypothetical protein